MEVSYAFVATAAELTPDGRLHAFNVGIDAVLAKLPGHSAIPLYFAAKVRLAPEEAGRTYEALVEFLAPDGTVLAKIPERQEVPPMVPPSTRGLLGLVVAFSGLPINVEGEHRFRLSLDGREVATVPLNVTAVPQEERKVPGALEVQ